MAFADNTATGLLSFRNVATRFPSCLKMTSPDFIFLAVAPPISFGQPCRFVRIVEHTYVFFSSSVFTRATRGKTVIKIKMVTLVQEGSTNLHHNVVSKSVWQWIPDASQVNIKV